MLEKTFSYSFQDDSPREEQPPHIKPSLRIHQLAALHTMKERETQFRTGYRFQGETLFSTFGILADPVGMGKTLTSLAHISQMALVQHSTDSAPLSNLHPSSTSSFFSITPQESGNVQFQNLIVVPHILFRQWQDAIEHQTTLKSCILKSLRDLDRDDLVTRLSTSHTALISNTLLPAFLTNLRAREVYPTWNRLFFDEADTIKIPSTCPYPKTNFTWFITATYSNLLFTDSYIHSYVCRQLPPQLLLDFSSELQQILRSYLEENTRIHFYRVTSKGFFAPFLQTQHPMRWLTVLRSSTEFLSTSIHLPPLHRETIQCLMPPSHRLVEQTLPEEAISLLHAGDVPGALSFLGVASHTQTTLVEAVCCYKKKELEKFRRLYEFKKGESYANPSAKESALELLQDKIKILEDQISTLSQRLETVSKDGCGICFEPLQEKVLTPCCNKVFCGTCILEWATRSTTCPLCRQSFHPSALISVGYSTPTNSRPQLPKKIDALCTYIEAHPKGRFIIFCRYDFPLAQIVAKLGPAMSPVIVEGNKDAVASKVKDFTEGNSRILLMNSSHSVAGLNLQAATHCVLWHKMRTEEEQQILGRAYRMGRSTPLTLVQLLHERE